MRYTYRMKQQLLPSYFLFTGHVFNFWKYSNDATKQIALVNGFFNGNHSGQGDNLVFFEDEQGEVHQMDECDFRRKFRPDPDRSKLTLAQLLR